MKRNQTKVLFGELATNSSVEPNSPRTMRYYMIKALLNESPSM